MDSYTSDRPRNASGRGRIAGAIVELGGELDLHTSGDLRDEMNGLIEAGVVRIAVDLAEVSFMDSSSLGVLVVCLKRVRERGGDLAIAGADGSPLKVLTLTGMDEVFTMAPSSRELPNDGSTA
jgi:anti-sigma B factor antagonist